MRIGRHDSLIAILAASSTLFAQSDIPDVRQIVASSVVATQRHWREWVLYSYLERDENRRLDTAGRVKSEEVDVSRAILVNGVQFEQLVERNGRPLPAAEERKQNGGTRQVEAPDSGAERRAAA